MKKISYKTKYTAVMFLMCALGGMVVFPLTQKLYSLAAGTVFVWTAKEHLLVPLVAAVFCTAGIRLLERRKEKMTSDEKK